VLIFLNRVFKLVLPASTKLKQRGNPLAKTNYSIIAENTSVIIFQTPE